MVSNRLDSIYNATHDPISSHMVPLAQKKTTQNEHAELSYLQVWPETMQDTLQYGVRHVYLRGLKVRKLLLYSLTSNKFNLYLAAKLYSTYLRDSVHPQ